MTRKVRRVRRSRRPAKNNGAEQRPAQTSEEEFQAEYAYVLQDLRRVFILAAAMFLLLIVLNIILG